MLIHNKLAQHLHGRLAHTHGAPIAGRSVEELERGGGIIHWAREYDRYFGWFTSLTDRTVIALAGIRAGDTVLDVGSGPGRLTLAAARAVGPAGQAHGVDASPEMVALAQQKAGCSGLHVAFHNASAAALPLADAMLDAAISRLVMHHLPPAVRQAGMAEIRRTLKPGGRCVLVDFGGPALDDAVSQLEALGFVDVQRGTLWLPGLRYVRASAPAASPRSQ